MDHDIKITTSEIESLLGRYFENESKNEKEAHCSGDETEQQDRESIIESLVRPDSLSIFDATCEYIITGKKVIMQVI